MPDKFCSREHRHVLQDQSRRQFRLLIDEADGGGEIRPVGRDAHRRQRTFSSHEPFPDNRILHALSVSFTSGEKSSTARMNIAPRSQ